MNDHPLEDLPDITQNEIENIIEHNIDKIVDSFIPLDFEKTTLEKLKKTSGLPFKDLTDEEYKLELEKINIKARAQERHASIRLVAKQLISTDEKGKAHIDYSRAAAWVRSQHHTISFRHEIWIYADGVYRRNLDDLPSFIKEMFDAGEWRGSILTATREIMFQILSTSPEIENPFNIRPDLIPVKNGVVKIDFKTGKVSLLPHSPEYQFIYQIPVEFNADASTEPVMEVLKMWVSAEDVSSLLQFPAQAILQAQLRDAFKKAYLFDGDADAGKTSYVKLIRAFFGKDQTADVDLRAICGNRFALSVLEGRLINFHDDLGEFELYYLGPFKKVTGDVWHRLERKGKDSYDGLITAVHGFTCNGPPKIDNITDDAFFSRWNYIKFPNSFKRDPTWAARIFTPDFLSGFLNLIIKAMIKIRETTPPVLLHDMDQLEVSELWIHATEPLSLFIDTHLIRDPGFLIGNDEFYEGWVRYCKDNEISATSKTAFTQALGKIGIHLRKKMSGKEKKYEGVRWRDDSPYRTQHEVITPNQKLVDD